MKDVAFLALRYLLFHRWKTAILVSAITVILLVPMALELVLERSAARLRARAEATPLLLGAPGSPLELTLGALYFSGQISTPLPYSAVSEVIETGFADAIPLSIGYRVGPHPVVGTSPDYLAFRDLELARGRPFALAGEAVLGAAAARNLAVEPGDAITTAPATAFDLAGSYPVKLTVVGTLEPTGTADDQAVFVDSRTAWIVSGIGHGHQDLQTPEADSAVLRRDGTNVIANASLMQYQVITPETLAKFHFHGNKEDFPVSAVFAVPAHQRASVLLQGRYQDPESPQRILRPAVVMDELLATVYTVRQYVIAAVVVVSAATFATITLVFLLSIRLRRAEIATMTRIGAAPGRVAAMLTMEIVLVLGAGLLLATTLAALISAYEEVLFRWYLSSTLG